MKLIWWYSEMCPFKFLYKIMPYKIRIEIWGLFSLNCLSSEAIVKTTEYFMQKVNKYINMKHSTEI